MKPLLLLPLLWIVQAHALEDYQPAELVEPVLPVVRSEDSGMVELVFMVDENGEVQEPAVVRATLLGWEERAIQAIRKFKFKPAQIGDRKVASIARYNMEFDSSRIPNRLGFPNPMDAPDGYMSLYNTFTKLLNKEEPNKRKAKHTLNKMRELALRTFFTGVHNELAQIRYYEIFGPKSAQIERIKHVLMFKDVEWGGNNALDAEMLKTMRMILIQRQLENGQYADALMNYRNWSKQDSDLKTTFAEAAAQIEDIQRSERVIARSIKITSRGQAFLPLLKRSFSILPGDKKIDELKLRCEAKFLTLQYSPDATYQLPASFGECELQILGEPGDEFTVLQQ